MPDINKFEKIQGTVMIRFLLEKEFKMIRRNKFLSRVIIMMPIVMMCIMPFAANLEVRGINLAVVDNDNSTTSAALIEKIISSDYFTLVDNPRSYAKGLDGVKEGQTDIILEIPRDFEKNMMLGISSHMQISANAVNAIKSSIGSNYLSVIVQDFTLNKHPEAMPKAEISSQFRFNPYLDYKRFMVPALMVMLLTIMCGSMPAMNIVGEKEHGTIEQMNVTPVGKFQFIFSKIIPYWVIGYIVLTICFIVAYTVYGVVAMGAYLTIYVAASVFILVVSGMGLIVSNYSSTLQQAMLVNFFFLIIMILLSGLLTPISSMPLWAQDITIVNPLRYFIDIIRGVYIKGSTLSDILPEIGVLGIFAVVLNSWAIMSYHKRG